MKMFLNLQANMSTPMKTAVVILNWNGKGMLERFLPPLLASTGPEARVIVADNASTDGSMEMMKEKFPEVATMSFSRNWGFAGGYNRALMQLDAEYFLLLNSDIEVSGRWLEPLEEWMDSHPECGICAPKLHSCAEKDRFEYAGAAGGYIDRFGYPFCRGRVLGMTEKDEGQYDTPADVLWVSGACLMIRSGLYRESGGLDEKFFAHMEEIDLCWRVQLSGYRVTAVPYSTVYHVGGGSLPNGAPRKLYLNYRNNLLMLRKNLAKTIALGLYRRDGSKKPECAVKGLRKAKRIIFTRMLLDGMSWVVYLMTFRWKYCAAVIDAHRDFMKSRDRISEETVVQYLKQYAGKGNVTGISDRWIIPYAVFCRRRIFRLVRKWTGAKQDSPAHTPDKEN